MEGRGSRHLGELARPLQPERTPWYVRRPIPPGLERSFPAEGWYWIPHGFNVAVFLAHSYELAAHELRNLIDRGQ